MSKFTRITISRARRAITFEQTVSFSDLTPAELAQIEARATPQDPYEILRERTIALAEYLDCDEATAERIILERV